jgi:hypothetical protein
MHRSQLVGADDREAATGCLPGHIVVIDAVNVGEAVAEEVRWVADELDRAEVG